MLQAAINIDSLMRRRRCDKLHGGSIVPVADRSSMSSIDSQLYHDDRDLGLPYLHSTPQLGVFPSEYCYAV